MENPRNPISTPYYEVLGTHHQNQSELLKDNNIILKFMRTKKGESQHETTFVEIGQGFSGKVFKFNYNHHNYCYKVYNRVIEFIKDDEIQESEDYLKHLYFFSKEGRSYKIFDYLDEYVTLSDFLKMHEITNIDQCHIMDIKFSRWTIINNLAYLISRLHQSNIVHRDLHPDNIMIHKHNITLKVIDLDTICISDDDCKDNIDKRYMQKKIYMIKKYDKSFHSITYAKDIDWYAFGIICIHILTYGRKDIESISDHLRELDDTQIESYIMNDLFKYIYPTCSIHYDIVTKFYNLFLKFCLLDNKNKESLLSKSNLQASLIKLIKSSYFIIGGEARFIEHVIHHKNIFIYIFTHAFPDKIIILYSHSKKEYYDINLNVIDIRNYGLENPRLDMVIRGTFEFVGCNMVYDVNRTMQSKSIPLPIDHQCKPLDPFFKYDCPYMCWSMEPFRCEIDPEKLPFCEINSTTNMSQYESPYDTRLYTNIPWYGYKMRQKIDRQTNSLYIPYCLQYFVDSIPFNTETIPLTVFPGLEGKQKKYNFIYVASNCSSHIREKLFSILLGLDPNKDGPDENKMVRAYGICSKNMKAKLDADKIFSGEVSGTPDELKKYSFRQSHLKSQWAFLPSYYSEYKFIFALENMLTPGYISEKILIAFQSGSIPIYYGTSDIFKYFDANSFFYVNRYFKDEHNPTEQEITGVAIELNRLANDESIETGWRKFTRSPIFKDNIVPELFLYKTSDYMKDIIHNINRLYYQSLNSTENKYLKQNNKNFKELYYKYKQKYLNLKDKL